MTLNYTKKTATDYHRLIVSQFCEFERGTYGAKLNEAVKAYNIHPIPEFWDWMFINCNFKIISPSYFSTPEGIQLIQSKKKLMDLEPKEVLTKVELGDRIGEDKEIKKKRNLLDFIRDGEKESS